MVYYDFSRNIRVTIKTKNKRSKLMRRVKKNIAYVLIMTYTNISNVISCNMKYKDIKYIYYGIIFITHSLFYVTSKGQILDYRPYGSK